MLSVLMPPVQEKHAFHAYPLWQEKACLVCLSPSRVEKKHAYYAYPYLRDKEKHAFYAYPPGSPPAQAAQDPQALGQVVQQAAVLHVAGHRLASPGDRLGVPAGEVGQ